MRSISYSFRNALKDSPTYMNHVDYMTIFPLQWGIGVLELSRMIGVITNRSIVSCTNVGLSSRSIQSTSPPALLIII